MIARRQTSIKVDAVAWDEAKEIFKEYNLSVTDAINIFLNKVKLIPTPVNNQIFKRIYCALV
ncbi:hypothetical protein JHD48_06110 [Sulfurimonas sp. SAG-AH-194-I05]|nr:hypothetical protein [Sulfurimonas sp. SAG-AH-194-I05]MDF1875301.1 hypothetical protein [Sulfurimonas sp. SAG-AH-194-I05]